MVNDGELIITNFIDNDKAAYSQIAFTALTFLEPSITPSDITLARPLSVPPKNSEQTNRSSRIAVLLSSRSLNSKVLLAMSKRTRLSTDDLNTSLLGGELSKHVKHCKIFINEALSKERFKLFCNLKSAAKNLGIKYVWHRGGKFMARVRGGERLHVFESLSDLQAIRSASRRNPDALQAANAEDPRAGMEHLQ